MVVVAEVFIGEMVHNVHGADGHTILILRTFVDDGEGILHHALCGHTSAARTPFFVDDAPFLVNLLVGEQEVVAPVVEDKESGVHR